MISKPLGINSFIVLLGLVLLLGVLVHWRAGVREKQAESDYPASGQFVDVQGTRIHLSITGSGPDIVLIHGASGSLRDFSFALVDRLNARYRVIAVDRPGLGRSERPRGYGGMWRTDPESPALQAALLQEAVAAVGVTQPIVLGHSYGGAIALAWGLEHPKDTAALVLLAAASNPWPGSLGPLYQINSTRFGAAIAVPMITALTPPPVIENTLSEIFAPQDPPKGYMQFIGPEMTLRRATLRANAQQVNGLKPFITTMAERYGTLPMPVEILHGTQDVIVPMDIHSIPLSQQIPGAVLTRLQGVGHMPHHADPDAVIGAIDRAAARAGLR